MITYYMDTAGSNTSPYDTWAKAATDLQTLLDLAVAGDICYCRGTQTLAAPLDVDTQTGDVVSGFIKFIGCAADGSVDGTRFVLDGNSAAANCLLATTMSYIWFENFELKLATGDGFDATGAADKWVWINCISHNNGTAGWDMYGADEHIFIRSIAYSNTNDGWKDVYYYSKFFFCSAYGNADCGFDGSTGTISCVWIGCVATDNGDNDKGWNELDEHCVVFNCVIDGTNQTGEIGIHLNDLTCIVLGCRITNLASGIDADSMLGLYGWNYFHNNTADLANATLLANIPHDEELTNHYNAVDGSNKADVDADDGFNDAANKDFNLKETRTLRKTAIGLGIG